MRLLTAVKYAVAFIVGIPLLLIVLIFVAGMIMGLYARTETLRLEEFCNSIQARTPLDQFHEVAGNGGYRIYTRTSLPEDETAESRVAARLLTDASRKGQESVSVIVTKTGIGFHACLIHHDGKEIAGATFVGDD